MRLLVATVVPLGMLAAVNPCAFPLLPAYLARFSGVDSTSTGLAGRARRSLFTGGAMTLGFVTVFTVIGGTTSIALHAVLAAAPVCLVALGAALVVVAVLSAAGRMPGLRLARYTSPSGTGSLTAFGFGVAYATASLGCALPLFAAAMGRGAATAGWGGVLAAVLGYAAGMGLLVTGVGQVVAWCGAAAAQRLTWLTRHATAVGAVLTALTGLSLAFVGFRDLGLPAPPAVAAAQSRAAQVLAASPAVLAGVLGVVVVVGLAIIAVRGSGRQRAQR